MARSIIKLKSSILLTAALLLGACGGHTVPVMNVSNSPVVTGSGGQVSAAQVRSAIVAALVAANWTIQADAAARVTAVFRAGGHSASVNIDYTSATYSITYLSSSPELRYDGQKIHRRYNQWVDRLRHAIATQLVKLEGGASAGAPAVNEIPPGWRSPD